MKITDKMRLDWLSRNLWSFYSGDCFQLNSIHGDQDGYSYARSSPRKAIDAAIKQEKRGKKA